MALVPRVWRAALAAGLVSTGAWAQGITAPPPLPPGITTQQLAPVPGVPGQPFAAPPQAPMPGPPSTADKVAKSARR